MDFLADEDSDAFCENINNFTGDLRGATVGREGGHDSLGKNEWSDWPFILFLRFFWPKKSF